MKYLLIALCFIVFLPATTLAQTNWKASDYKPEKYRKVMVLAKVMETSAKRKLEDLTVQSRHIQI
jgi:hypothetical protein